MKYGLRLLLVPALFLLSAATAPAVAPETARAFHSLPDRTPDSLSVPGMDRHFFEPAGTGMTVHTGEAVTLFILTDRGFARGAEEQIYVRWWDGYVTHWVMGFWVRNVTAGEAAAVLPSYEGVADPAELLDVWQVEIPSWMTQPGDNYYAIQLKAYAPGGAEARYILARAAGDFTATNRVGQIFSASEEIQEQDWKVTVLPN
ncbi:MAG: hypothetical protein IJS32_08750 [Kiritimatiellae bacterium]|nr:hypothetical protein [Kiritimatiellia bacterium]